MISIYRTVPSLTSPCLSWSCLTMPAMSVLTMPCDASPSRACHAGNCQAQPERAVPAMQNQSAPDTAYPGSSCPCLPNRAWSSPPQARRAMLCLAPPALPGQSRPVQADLACRAGPCPIQPRHLLLFEVQVNRPPDQFGHSKPALSRKLFEGIQLLLSQHD